MTLTPAQLTTLKADILANPNQTVIDALAAGANNAIADWYNLDASPDYWIYRKVVEVQEIRNAINLQNMVDITDTDRARVDTMLSIRSATNFSGEVASDRSAWSDVFSAAAGDESQQAILALWTRLASNVEKVFALSTNTGATAALADTTSFQGQVSSRDVRDALNS